MELNYCSNCGEKLEVRVINDEERKACPSCSFVHWGNYSVSVGALVIKEGKMLLVRRKHNPVKGSGQILGAISSKRNSLNKVSCVRC